MLDEITSLMEEIKGITNNITHDLRTPLTHIRNRLESSFPIIISRQDEYKYMAEVSIADIDALIKTFNALLKIAQAESGATQSNEDVDLSKITSDVVELYQPLAEEKYVMVITEFEPNAVIKGNMHILFEAISNIMDNAVKYTDSGGKIIISIKSIAKGVIISICDNGIEVEETDYEHITKKFVRLNSAEYLPGAGLGLSFVKAAADMHNAKLYFTWLGRKSNAAKLSYV